MGNKYGPGSIAVSRRALCALALAMPVIGLAGCGGGGTIPQASISDPNAVQRAGAGRTVKVALLLPMSKEGEAGQIATDLKQAGELALFEFDKPNVSLISKDTKGTPEGAAAAAQEAIAAGAELIIGPLFAASVRAVQPVAAKAGVPIIAFSSDPGVAGNGVYLLSFLAGDDVGRIVTYTMAQGKRTFAALIPETPYGDLVAQAFNASVARQGGRVLVVERFPVDANGMLEPAKRVHEVIQQAAASGSPVEALFIPAGQESLPTLAPMLPYFDIDTQRDVKPIGIGNWDYPSIGQEDPLIGGWYPSPDPSGWRDFTRRYSATYGNAPARLASLAYDAVSLAVSLSNSPAGQRFTAANLTRASGFAGVDGLFRLKPDGRVERGLAVLEVQKFGSRVVDPAPSAFGSAQF